jgi:hypothetical protein
VEPVSRCGTRQGEATPHAESDDPHVVGGVVPVEQPPARGGEILEGPTVTAAQRAEGGLETSTRPTLAEQIGHDDDIAPVGKPMSEPARLLVQTEDLVNHHDTGEPLVARRPHRIPPQVRRTTGPRYGRREVDHGPEALRVRHGTTQPQGPRGHTPMVSAEV